MASMAVGNDEPSCAAALRTSVTCSAKPPWRARTPTVVVVGRMFDVVVVKMATGERREVAEQQVRKKSVLIFKDRVERC